MIMKPSQKREKNQSSRWENKFHKRKKINFTKGKNILLLVNKKEKKRDIEEGLFENWRPFSHLRPRLRFLAREKEALVIRREEKETIQMLCC